MNILKYFKIHKIAEKSIYNQKRGNNNFTLGDFPKINNKTVQIIENVPTITLAKDNQSKVHFFFLHGGAYVCEVEYFHTLFARNLLNKYDVRITFVDYPLAPESMVGNTVNKTYLVYQEIKALYPNDKIFLLGDSAGGGLALTLTQLLRDKKEPLPFGTILLSPWVDLSLTNPKIEYLKNVDILLPENGLMHAAKEYAGDIPLDDKRVSPLYDSQNNLGNIFVTVGESELFYADLIILIEKMKKATKTKVSFSIGKKMFHDYALIPLKEGRRALKEIMYFVKDIIA
jgi:acetyl esterase/lipase